jgi:hypothetical protein
MENLNPANFPLQRPVKQKQKHTPADINRTYFWVSLHRCWILKHITAQFVRELGWLTTVSGRCSLLRAYRKIIRLLLEDHSWWQNRQSHLLTLFQTALVYVTGYPAKFCSYTHISGNPLEGFTFTQGNSLSNTKLNMWSCPCPRHEDVEGSRGKAPLILKFGARWKTRCQLHTRLFNFGITPTVGNE